MAGVLDQLRRLYTVMGREDLLETSLYSNQNERVKYRDEIDILVKEWTKDKTTDEIQTILKEVDIPCSKLPTFSEVCTNPQLLSRNAIIEVEQVISGKVKVPGSIFKLSKTPGRIDYPAHSSVRITIRYLVKCWVIQMRKSASYLMKASFK
jgi:crotonobetainyl-CoA:carnitine CoA-transferase CaiB-like acyl-CoA transferase